MASIGGVCVNGTLDATSYNSPVPFVGLYIVVATLVCFFCMTFDLVYGLFIGRKPFLPCKLFHLNAFTLTVLAIATKIPNDLTTQMPRVEDQLSKLMGTALLCTALGYYMPSLGTLDSSERYGNLAALSVTAITVVVNVGIQIHTGVIFDFTTEHIIILVCISVMLLFMWSSAIGLRDQINDAITAARVSMSSHGCKVEDLNGLRELVQSVHKHNYKANPQTLLCSNANHHIFGILCALSLVLVLKSMFESFVLRSMKSCNGVSDYKWSILFVIVAQFLAIVVGTFSVIYRWLSYLLHFDDVSFSSGSPLLELEYLKVNILPLTFLNKNLSHVLVVAKDFLINVLIVAQSILYICSRVGFELPIYIIKGFFDCMINGDAQPFDSWMDEMVNKEMTRYRKTYTRDLPFNLISLISDCPTSKSECDQFIGKLEAVGRKEVLERIGGRSGYDYRVSTVSILVLSGVLVELMPTSRKEFLMQILVESFEIIYFVDRKTHTPNTNEVKRWMTTKDMWAHWQNPNHWFRKMIISDVFKKKYDEDFKSEQPHDACGVLRDAHDAIQTSFDEYDVVGTLTDSDTLDGWHWALVIIEFLIICKFLGEQCESVEDPINFLEMCFIKMLCFILSDLPLAILKEIEGDDPTEMDEGRVREAVKFLCKLELLQNNKAGWSWPNKSAPNTQASEVHSDATGAYAGDVDDDGDTIQEIGSAEIV